jgi:acetyl-CoA carboxylase carboxyltransferase component
MGYVDEVIEPRETRARLITALTVLRDKAVTVLPKRHGNMPV